MEHGDDGERETLERRRESTIRHWTRVSGLLGRRADLEGVVPMADLIHESVRWAA